MRRLNFDIARLISEIQTLKFHKDLANEASSALQKLRGQPLETFLRSLGDIHPIDRETIRETITQFLKTEEEQEQIEILAQDIANHETAIEELDRTIKEELEALKDSINSVFDSLNSKKILPEDIEGVIGEYLVGEFLMRKMRD